MARGRKLPADNGKLYRFERKFVTTALDREAREALWRWSSRFCGIDDDQIPVVAG